MSLISRIAAKNQRIIRRGLVLYLDAGNRASYPGTGTTWTDLSGVSNNSTLRNSPSFNGDNRGSLVFNGNNDSEINNFSSDSNHAMSICCWVNPSSLTEGSFGGVFLNWIINKRQQESIANSWQLVATNSKISFDAGTSSNTLITPSGNDQRSAGVYTLQLNTWQFISISTSGVNGGFLNTYYNGELNFSGSLTGDRGINTQKVSIAVAGWVDQLRWFGKISQIYMYNRALTAQEIKQNFNADRRRYGI